MILCGAVGTLLSYPEILTLCWAQAQTRAGVSGCGAWEGLQEQLQNPLGLQWEPGACPGLGIAAAGMGIGG